jgi:hypothetical protein
MTFKSILAHLIVAIVMTAVCYAGLSLFGLVCWNFGNKLIYFLVSVVSISAVGIGLKWVDSRL